MLTKESRLSFIRSRHAALFGVAISGLLPVSRAEIRETVLETVADSAEKRAEKGRENDEETEKFAFTSNLQFDAIPRYSGESEENILLSRSEKQRLTREMDFFRADSRRSFALVLVS